MDARLAAANFKYCEDTADLKSHIECDLVELGGRLQKIRDEGKYAPNFESFAEYLDSIHLKASDASKFITVFQHFVEKLEFTPRQIASAGGVYAAYEIVAVASTRRKAESWLAKARDLRRSDLRKELTEARTGIEMSGCVHPQTETVTFKKCLHCGDSWRVYPDGEEPNHVHQ